MTVTYPEVKVQLTGTDGNAFAVLSKVQRAMREAGIGPLAIAEFVKEATSGDYDHLLATCIRTVDVE